MSTTPSMSGGRYVLPSFEEKTPYGFRTQDPYTRLFRDRIIFVASPIDPTSSNDIMSQLLVLENLSDDTPITMYINSPGGLFEDMTAIFDTMQYIKSPVHTVCLGRADGVASVLLAGGEKGYRMALPNSRIVLQQPEANNPGRGQASDIQIEAEEITRTSEWLEETLSSLTGTGKKKIATDISRSFYLTAEKAVKYGIIDGILKR